MRVLALATVLAISMSANAHDEGHGPKLTEKAQQGGSLAPVVFLKDAKKGAAAEAQMKSEFVRSEDGTVKVYVYDMAMKPIDLAKFEKSAKGVVETVKKGKVDKKLNFSLDLKDGAFVGSAPKAPTKPFNMYVVLKMNGTEYLAELDNLD